MRKLYIDLRIPDTVLAAHWAACLQELLADAVTAGVNAVIHDEAEVYTDVVAVRDVNAFLQVWDKRDVARVSRSMFYYILTDLNDRVVAWCTRCKRRYGECRCSDRGGDLGRGRGWEHKPWLSPTSPRCEEFWVVDRATLLALDLSALPRDAKDHTGSRRKRLVAFVEHLRSQTSS